MKKEMPILEYHDLSDKPHKIKNFHSPYVLLKTKFYDQMEWLSRNGYQTLTIDDLLNGNISEKSIILTFDDGHISNYKLAFPILKNFNFVATFFVIPEFFSKKDYITKQQILEMNEQSMKFESHSLTHPYLISLTERAIVREVVESKQRIQDLVKGEVKHFSVPYGFYNNYLIMCLKEAGYRSLVTENFGYYKYKDNPLHVLPRFTIKSHFDLKTFQNIVECRRMALLSNYGKALGIRYCKAILGYRNYIHLKSLILRRTPQPFANRPNHN